MGITNSTHFNPCFWAAFWNLDYFRSIINGERVGKPREQQIYALNFKSGKVLSTNIQNVHCDKNIGLADITPEYMIKFCQKYYPNDVKHMSEYLKEHPEELILDIENLWCAIEETPAYKTLIQIVIKNDIDVEKELDWIACFIVLQRFRSYAVFNSMLELSEIAEIPRFEHFWILKGLLSNTEFLNNLVKSIYRGKWTFYIIERHSFVLSDSAVCLKPNGYFVAISPRILLEIDIKSKDVGILVRKKYSITKQKLEEYNKYCIKNSFKEIISHDQNVLNSLTRNKYFIKQMRYIDDNRSFIKKIASIGNSEIIRTKIYN